jgi:hypothetical protein
MEKALRGNGNEVQKEVQKTTVTNYKELPLHTPNDSSFPMKIEAKIKINFISENKQTLAIHKQESIISVIEHK